MKNITLEIAIQEFKNLTPGTKFKVKDLFVDEEWEDTATTYRMNLGTRFFHYTKKYYIEDIRPLCKTLEGQQMYIKL
jgi:hypothetical protein